MAKNNTLKSSTSLSSESTALVVPFIKKNKGNSSLLSLIDKALAGAKNVVQSIVSVEPLIAEAALACHAHCIKHRDAMPADRLVKGLIALNHPAASSMAREVVGWFRLNSPIAWNAKQEVYINKDPKAGRVDYDEAQAAEVPFNQTAQAKRARTAAERAHKQNMKEADFPMMLNRAKGVLGWFNNMATGKDERKIKTEDQPKMIRFGSKLNELLKEYGGETATVELAKPEKAVKQKKAA